ncbi:alpha/beta fold hydrolase [Bradyrhizobium hipponense]|uniref:Alpha/beta fold hydrolase n=1 Tax=Bradyrhizobium hipponense TaxID=2605638 RepID=A0A5S4YPD2_9BRAD|nr:alpha/beta hydrolase [Bradyrhizobium hipponense]TYO62189.1 alpha/beta fold hydrolase [Bradyrhizobium hipponense]
MFVGLGQSSGICRAEPIIDAQVVLQICQAFSNKSLEKMPAIVLPEAAKQFLETYGRLSEKFDGCLSAIETKSWRQAGTIFLLQHTRYESYWRFSADETSIKEISIRHYRPVTLAGDAEWEEPFRDRPPSTSAGKTTHIYIDSPPDNPNIIEFFYATNRRESDQPVSLEDNPMPTSKRNSTTVFSSSGWTAVSGFTGERNADLSFGAARVRVPEGHQIGKIELPSTIKILGIAFRSDSADPTRHFTVRSIAKTSEDQWIKSLSSTKKKRALIFVHGFNTKFQDAVFRTAQIVWDLQYSGAAVLFSWPSRGEIADYLYDKESALGSRAALLRVIDNLRKAKFESIDIIAHSMGNLIAVDALSNASATKSPPLIAQFVMAAPDVDRDMFLQDIPKVAKVAKGLTLYASANDKALQLSKRVAGNIPRAGDVPPSGPIIIASVSTIDVSAIGDELFGLNHNAFATTRNVLNDLKILIETGAKPPRLAEIRGYPEPPQKPIYFRYSP